jgi:hypothetical protein
VSAKQAFAPEKKAVASLGALSVALTLVLAALPLVVSPLFLS